MTTDPLIMGLRCFIAIRGTVSSIRCDQGSNFVGASNEFKVAMKELDKARITVFLTKKQCEFIFNAPHSSHAGGVWEWQIRTIRSVLNATTSLSHGRLDDSSLRCLFYEAMFIVNSCPLAFAYSDQGSESITPNHLVTMKPTQPLPLPGSFLQEDVYACKRWRRVQYLMQQFWSRWKKEYLLHLSAWQKWTVPHRNVKVRDIVLLVDDNAPRMEWSLAIITEVKTNDDGPVRRVKAHKGNPELDKYGKVLKQISVLERPIQKVVVLVENKETLSS